MNYYPPRVRIVATIGALIAIALLPIYGLWIFTGAMADRRERRACAVRQGQIAEAMADQWGAVEQIQEAAE